MDSQLRTDRVKVREVLERLRSGTLVVPEFQRAYVWKPNRAAKLIDSLYRKFPIGCLLSWETTETVQERGKSRSGSRPFGATAQFLIDGQQRTRTLERVLVAGDEDSLDIFFHAIQGEFARGSASRRKDPLWVRVTELWNEDWHQLVDALREEYPDEALKIRRNVERCREILDYEIPLVVMRGHSFAEAVEAFERINTLGVRLKMEDLQSAELAAQHVGFIRDRVIPFLAELRERGLDRLTTSQIYRVVGALARPDGRQRVGIHRLERRELDLAWERMRKALDRLEELLREELGVAGMKHIWSGSLLVPPLVVLGHHKPGIREARRLCGWIGAAALHHRYRGSTEAALEQDIRAALRNEPVDGLLRNLRRSAERRRLEAEPDDFWAAHLFDRGALFAAYLACREREARDPFAGKKLPVLPAGVAPRKHLIFPRTTFPADDRREADYVVNVLFAHPETEIAVGTRPAGEYLGELRGGDLESQCVPTENALWENYEQFCLARASELSEAFNDFLGRCGIR